MSGLIISEKWLKKCKSDGSVTFFSFPTTWSKTSRLMPLGWDLHHCFLWLSGVQDQTWNTRVFPGSSVSDSRSSDHQSQKSLEQTPTNKSLYLCSTYTSMDLSLSLSFPPSIDTFLWRKPINLALLKCILSGMQMYDCAEDD